MSTILSINGNCVTKFISNVVGLFTKNCKESAKINEIARETKALQRERSSCSFKEFLCSAINFVGTLGLHQQSYHLENNRIQYLEHSNRSISNKGCTQRLSKPENVDFLTECLNQVLHQYKVKAEKMHDKHASKEIQAILKQTNAKDVCFIDGCEITLRESTRGKFPNKGPGRKKLNGKKAAPAIKLHVLYSYLSRTFVKIDVTEAVEDERQHVFIEALRGCILIADRGYISEELEEYLINNGVKVIIKGRINMTSGIIVEAYDENHKRLDEYIGKKYADIKTRNDKYLDVTVQTRRSHQIRIVRMLNPNCNSTRKDTDTEAKAQEKTEGQYIYLRTNITREELSVDKMFKMYRFRWCIEFFFACLQQGNCLKSINSSNKNIILSYILISLIAALLKSYLALCSVLRQGIKLISVSMLKLHYKFFLFDELFFKVGKNQ